MSMVTHWLPVLIHMRFWSSPAWTSSTHTHTHTHTHTNSNNNKQQNKNRHFDTKENTHTHTHNIHNTKQQNKTKTKAELQVSIKSSRCFFPIIVKAGKKGAGEREEKANQCYCSDRDLPNPPISIRNLPIQANTRR